MKSDKHEIERDVMAYLAGHPDAQDTLEGIAEWWLLEQRIKHEIGAVREALTNLVRAGSIQKVNRKNMLHYRLNTKKKEGHISNEGRK